MIHDFVLLRVNFICFAFTGRFVVNGVQPQASGENSKVKVKVRVNIHGIFNISSASMVEKLAQVMMINLMVSDMICQ